MKFATPWYADNSTYMIAVGPSKPNTQIYYDLRCNSDLFQYRRNSIKPCGVIIGRCDVCSNELRSDRRSMSVNVQQVAGQKKNRAATLQSLVLLFSVVALTRQICG